MGLEGGAESSTDDEAEAIDVRENVVVRLRYRATPGRSDSGLEEEVLVRIEPRSQLRPQVVPTVGTEGVTSLPLDEGRIERDPEIEREARHRFEFEARRDAPETGCPERHLTRLSRLVSVGAIAEIGARVEPEALAEARRPLESEHPVGADDTRFETHREAQAEADTEATKVDIRNVCFTRFESGDAVFMIDRSTLEFSDSRFEIADTSIEIGEGSLVGCHRLDERPDRVTEPRLVLRLSMTFLVGAHGLEACDALDDVLDVLTTEVGACVRNRTADDHSMTAVTHLPTSITTFHPEGQSLVTRTVVGSPRRGVSMPIDRVGPVDTYVLPPSRRMMWRGVRHRLTRRTTCAALPGRRRTGRLGAVDRVEDPWEAIEPVDLHSAHLHEMAKVLDRVGLLPGAGNPDTRERVRVTSGVRLREPDALRLDGREAHRESRTSHDRSRVGTVPLLRGRREGGEENGQGDRESHELDAVHLFLLLPFSGIFPLFGDCKRS